MGPTVKVGYLPQIIRFSHPERNLVDTMIYDQDCSTQTARNRLAAFNFRGRTCSSPCPPSPAGEQSRLRLCMLMDEKINLLILDEPTNHLDVASREWIEEAVESYEGNLLFVSHDRYFINRFATRIWMLENGQIIDFRGTFEEYRAAQERKRLQAAVLVKAEPEKPKRKSPPSRRHQRAGEAGGRGGAGGGQGGGAAIRADPQGRGGGLQLSGAAEGL